MFAPSAKRFAYLPCTPPEKSYSGSMSSEGDSALALFMFSFLMARRDAGTDNADILSPLGGNDNQGLSGNEWPVITKRCSPSEWVGPGIVREGGSAKTIMAAWKDTPCFLEILLGPLWVPFEFKEHAEAPL